jgi:hypothetical protein
MTSVLDIILSLGDPTALARMLPDSLIWPHYLALMLRAYMIPVFAYWIGLGLLVLGAVLGVYQYLVGGIGIKDLVFKLSLPALLWPLVVISPSQVGCNPKYQTYPCVLSGEWRAQKITTSQDTVMTYEFDPAKGGLVPVPVAVNVRTMYQITFNPAPGPGVSNDSFLGRQLKAFWGWTARTANQALYAELARLQNQVRAYKKNLTSLILYSSLFAGVGGAGSVLLNAVSFLAIGGSVGLGIGFMAGLVEGTVDTVSQIVTGVAGSVATVMIYAPLVLLTVFHTLILLSGALLYFVLFLSPIVLGLAAIQGPGTLQTPIKLIFLSVLFPLFVGPIFAASLRMAYGNVVSEKQKQLEAIEGALDSMVRNKDGTYSVRYSIAIGVMLQQLHNTLYCLEGKAGAPVICPSQVVVRSVSEAEGAVAELVNLVRQGGRGQFWAPQNVALYPAIFVGDPERVKNTLKGLLQSSSVLDLLNRRASYEALMELFRNNPPLFVWNWREYVKEAKKGAQGEQRKLLEKLERQLGTVHDDFACTAINRSLDKLVKLSGEPSKVSGEIKRKSLALYGVDQGMKAKMGPWPDIPSRSGGSASPVCPGGSPFFSANAAYPIGGMSLQPYNFYGFLDFGYISKRLADRLPTEMSSAMRTTSAALFVSTLVGFLGALILALGAWSLISTLVSAGAGEGVDSAVGRVQGAGFLALGTAVLTANIAQTPFGRSTSHADQAVREESARVAAARVARATAAPPTVAGVPPMAGIAQNKAFSQGQTPKGQSPGGGT